jgi:hypothetical protein
MGMLDSWQQKSGTAKLLIIAITLILLGLGLCGAGFTGVRIYYAPAFLPSVGALLLLLGIIGLILAAILSIAGSDR